MKSPLPLPIVTYITHMRVTVFSENYIHHTCWRLAGHFRFQASLFFFLFFLLFIVLLNDPFFIVITRNMTSTLLKCSVNNMVWLTTNTVLVSRSLERSSSPVTETWPPPTLLLLLGVRLSWIISHRSASRVVENSAETPQKWIFYLLILGKTPVLMSGFTMCCSHTWNTLQGDLNCFCFKTNGWVVAVGIKDLWNR